MATSKNTQIRFTAIINEQDQKVLSQTQDPGGLFKQSFHEENICNSLMDIFKREDERNSFYKYALDIIHNRVDELEHKGHKLVDIRMIQRVYQGNLMYIAHLEFFDQKFITLHIVPPVVLVD